METIFMLQRSGDIEAMAKELGVRESVVQTGVAALLPAVLGGFKRKAYALPGGLSGLRGLLDQQGNEILGQVFGSKEVSRTVAAGAAQKTGISSDMLRKMLPVVAMMVAASIAEQSEARTRSGGIGDLIVGFFGGGRSQASRAGTSGALGTLFDWDGDGNPLDDMIGMAEKLVR